MSRTEILSWDHAEQPDLAELGRLVVEMSGGIIHLTPVEDTGDDQYAVIIAGRSFEQKAATGIYRYWLENGQETGS